MSGLSLKGIRKSYGSVEVIKDIDLEIQDREFVVFVGPSGCGKSTLLRMIAGLEPITSGELDIGGKRVNDIDPSKRGIAMVFQSYALYPHMTVRENMGFALRFAKVPKDEIERQVDAAAKVLGLGPLMDRRPKELSGGQRQRVAIGRAIVRHPNVFLFDEPLSNLDAELRVHMRIEIARLHRELATTIIYVTHDQIEAMTLADKIVVLNEGRVQQAGTPLQLYDDPDNLFVAGFIGSPKMNFLRAVVDEGSARLIDYGGQRIPLTVRAMPGQEVTLGIRPEHFQSDGQAKLDVEVEMVEHLGAETYAYARSAANEALTIATRNDRTIRAGDRITANFDPARALIFDGNGQRLR
jgi:lactose/L-arabinose transport system ATP-binding protein